MKLNVGIGKFVLINPFVCCIKYSSNNRT